jgi:hypothetical protein
MNNNELAMSNQTLPTAEGARNNDEEDSYYRRVEPIEWDNPDYATDQKITCGTWIIKVIPTDIHHDKAAYDKEYIYTMMAGVSQRRNPMDNISRVKVCICMSNQHH